MASQGIKGHKFIHGCTKETSKLKEDVMMKMNKPMMNVSHEISPIVEPHIHQWNKIYGNLGPSVWNRNNI